MPSNMGDQEFCGQDTVHISESVSWVAKEPTGKIIQQGSNNGSKMSRTDARDSTSTIKYSSSNAKKKDAHGSQNGWPRVSFVAKKVCRSINDVEHTDFIWENPQKPDDNREREGDDVLFKSKSSVSELRVQVTRSDSSVLPIIMRGEKNRKALEFNLPDSSKENLVANILSAIKKKAEKPGYADKKTLVLALDETCIVPDDQLNELKESHKTELKNTGFKSIWYVPENMDPIRLF